MVCFTRTHSSRPYTPLSLTTSYLPAAHRLDQYGVAHRQDRGLARLQPWAGASRAESGTSLGPYDRNLWVVDEGDCVRFLYTFSMSSSCEEGEVGGADGAVPDVLSVQGRVGGECGGVCGVTHS